MASLRSSAACTPTFTGKSLRSKSQVVSGDFVSPALSPSTTPRRRARCKSPEVTGCARSDPYFQWPGGIAEFCEVPSHAATRVPGPRVLASVEALATERGLVTEYLKAQEFGRCSQILERWRTVFYKSDSSWTSWENLLTRWPMFLDLLANLPDPGETAALPRKGRHLGADQGSLS